MRSVYVQKQDAFIRSLETPVKGPVLVYLPAISFSVAASFLSVVTHPHMPAHKAILVDYFGSGASDTPQNFRYTLKEHVASIATLLDDANCRNVTLVGHSMGGTVAICLAMARPDIVANLIVGEGNVTAGGGGLVKQIVSHSEADFVSTIFPKMKADIFESAKSGDMIGLRRNNVWKHVSPVGLYRNAQALNGVSDDLLDSFLALPIPKTFIYGDKTLPATDEQIGPDTPSPERLKLHGVNIGVVPNAGHGQMFDNLDGFVEVLSKFAF